MSWGNRRGRRVTSVRSGAGFGRVVFCLFLLPVVENGGVSDGPPLTKQKLACSCSKTQVVSGSANIVEDEE